MTVDEEPSLILWYRGESGIPLYTVDARNSSSLLTSTTVASPELDGRAYFDPGHGSSASYFLLNQMSPASSSSSSSLSSSSTASVASNANNKLIGSSNYHSISHGDLTSRRGNLASKSSKNDGLVSTDSLVSSKTGASLVLKTVFREDEDEYRCRCDFKKSRTLNFLLNLTVIGELISGCTCSLFNETHAE